MIEQLYVTTQGRHLWALGQTGVEINFTRAQIGDGELMPGQDITQLTALIHPRKYIPIAAKEVIDTVTSISVQITNADLTEGFSFREIGIWANDPDNGEILYAVGNAYDKAEWIPLPSVQRIDYLLALLLTMDNAPNVTIEYHPSSIFLSKDEAALLQSKIKRFTGTLAQGDWLGSAPPYSQQAQVDGLIPTDEPIVDLIVSSDFATAEAEEKGWAQIYRMVSGEGIVTVYAKKRPSVELNFKMKVARTT